jgi:hypothetical protein
MTAIPATNPDTARPAGTLSRITRVVKLHFANPWPVIITPWLILGLIFVVNLAIWWIVATAGGNSQEVSDGFQYSGASFYIFVYMLVVAVMAVNQSFAYALGFSSTRRDYYLGTALTFVILSAIYTAGFAVLGAIERATEGWGLQGSMFDSMFFGEGPLEQAFCVFVAFLFFFFVGAASGAVFVRWRAIGLTTFFAVLALVLVGGAALLTLTGNWPAFGAFFANAGFVGSYAWSLVLTAIAAVAGFFLLRRATPRSA